MNKCLFIVFFALFVLSACESGSNDAVQRRRAERFGVVPTPAQVATVAPTAEPTIAAPIAVSGDVQAAMDVDPDGDAFTQLISVALVVIFGIPAFWIISLRKTGGRK